MPDARVSLRLYRRLIGLYPASFRENYGELLEREFRDELEESGGIGRRGMLWFRLLADLAVSVPAQLAREAAQDARHALRLWARRPWQTGFAILALAIGIGANTGVFSVVNALLLRSLPFRDAASLVVLHTFQEPHDSSRQFEAWRRQSAYLADAALVEDGDVNLGGEGEWQRAHIAQTTWNFFQLLGTKPIVGRAFARGEDVAAPYLTAPEGSAPGPDAVAVIGYGLWQELYAGDARALGATIRMNGMPLTIIGVAPPGFDYPSGAVLWKPGRLSAGNNGWETIGRVKPGVPWARANAQFGAEAERFWPNRRPIDRIRYPSFMSSLKDDLAGPARNGSLVLMGCVVAILLIACTNVANLLMARTADRAGELSIRSALGASRARLRQQLLTECLLLALAASIAGLLVARWTTAIAAKLEPAPLATQDYSILDGRVLAFAIAAAVASGLLFGLLPSWYAGRIHTFGSRGAGRSRGSRLIRESLVAAQVALTLVLLAASFATSRAFVHLLQIDRGYNLKGVVTVNVSLNGTTHQTNAQCLAYFQQALERLRRLPGVRSASATESLPLYSIGSIGGRFQMDGRPATENSKVVYVLPDYFCTMGGRILRGREFTAADVEGNAGVAVVSERFAGEFGSPPDAVGRQISAGGRRHWTIVGVVKGMDYMVQGTENGRLEVRADPNATSANEVFLPSNGSGEATLVARVDGGAEARLAEIRDAVRSVDPQVPVFGVKTMEQRMADAMARPQLYRTAVSCFAGFALLLAAIGIYGIVSYTVSQRSHEMGVRLALGATPRRLRALLLWQGLLPIAAGAVPGVAVAVLSGRFLESLVDGARAVSAPAYLAAVLFIAGIAATGIWAATRPVTRLDIVEILRSE